MYIKSLIGGAIIVIAVFSGTYFPIPPPFYLTTFSPQ